MANTPGTVSKILWHFTGGPRWDDVNLCQLKSRKSSQTAYNALVSILTSKELRIGLYKEVIKAPIVLPETDSEGKIQASDYLVLKSLPVVCLADIPIIHLAYHADRYGKIAVGFHRSSAIRHGFSPVFYQFEDSDILDAMLRVHSGISFSYPEGTISDLMDKAIRSKNRDALDSLGDRGDLASTQSLEEMELRSIKSLLRFSEEALNEVLAYIKTFTIKEFETIYCEREWRSTKPFAFDHKDIAMIVVPRSGRHFQRFVKLCEKLFIPRDIPIVPWEDLVEH